MCVDTGWILFDDRSTLTVKEATGLNIKEKNVCFLWNVFFFFSHWLILVVWFQKGKQRILTVSTLDCKIKHIHNLLLYSEILRKIFKGHWILAQENKYHNNCNDQF